jgi:hypothetical protein
MYIFGEDIERVRITSDKSRAIASVVFASGYFATLIFTQKGRWGTFLVTQDGTIELKSRVEESKPARHYRDIVAMFRTGKEPRSHDSILKCVAVLEALEKSVSSQDWQMVIG